ncbi:DUF1810 domain-containing protein [Methylorubrum extorquens]|uniref:DUF1810 domain-containing protein n=1 Tax=Methylorubrum extorquens TaxID=408 RepID=UPI0020A09D68|nr:DUF1810 domain-containing protein [Methylorubrum extorquens]MCP1539936.1 uncharacterized protein (DUF1810 family) [Methylorubrum extorquens]
MRDDAFDLDRFVEAQDGLYEDALAELRNGRKQSHWMWFIFPQIAGLGSSAMARRYAIRSLAEAQAYLAHSLLGERLRTCTRAANAWEGRSARALFGAPDDVKFRSSMTLFAQADPGDSDFARALALFFEGRPDPLTLERLEQR